MFDRFGYPKVSLSPGESDAPPPLKIGWEPDGSGLDWDNVAHPKIPVIWCTFTSELGVPLPEPDDDGKQPAPEDLLPPTRADVAAIQNRVAKIDDRLASFANTMKFLAWLIVAVFVIGRLLH
jgi:hypothetical protein